MPVPKFAVYKFYDKFQMTSRLKKTKESKGIGEQEFKFNCNYDEKTDCPIPYISCVCKGCPIPDSLEGPDVGIRMRCTSDDCHLAKILVHKKCFERLEENLLKILTKRGSARGWTDVQRRSNLWEKKGQGLVGNFLHCHCSHGIMCLDVDFYKEKELDDQRKQALAAEAKQRKKKCSKKSKLPMVNYSNNGPVAPELLQYDFVPPGSKGLSRRQTSYSTSTLIYEQSDDSGPSVMEQALAAEAKQRKKKCSKKSKLPMVNYSKNGPVAPELLQDDCVPPGSKGLSRRQTSYSTSTLIYEQSDDSEPSVMVPVPSQKIAVSASASLPETSVFYSLFDPGARSFNLGELLLGESRLPGLITKPRLFSHLV